MPSTSRKFTAAAVAAVLAFTGAACSGDGDDADPVGGEVEDRGGDDGVTGTDDDGGTGTDDDGDTGDDDGAG